jgi:hypothetical protein
MTVAPVGPPPSAAAAPAAPRAGFAAALEARAAALAPASGPAPAPAAGRPHPAAAALAAIERAQTRLAQVLAAARAGRTFTPAELLALQAEAYRCAQVVDLGAKLAEQGAQAVRQALATQL